MDIKVTMNSFLKDKFVWEGFYFTQYLVSWDSPDR